ncbi:MAG: DUF4276 family protein [Planctomycetaceae bacterium]|jgi:hypothetical protein|nr:DUF4276 family protein [Planctomycetaceae bacterium]
MKLGLILECPIEGTDHQVYEYVVQQLCPQLEIIVEGHRNKKLMIDNCGKTAKLLLKKCDVVAIIWDLMPPWEKKRRGKRRKEPCRHNDIVKIQTNLENAKVNLSKVKLICIEPELEGWIIVDGSALTKYKKEIVSPHPVKKFNNVKQLNNSDDSKKRISKYLKQKYNKIVEAIKIVKHFDNFDKIAKKHTSFCRLKKFIEELSSCP